MFMYLSYKEISLWNHHSRERLAALHIQLKDHKARQVDNLQSYCIVFLQSYNSTPFTFVP